MYGLVDFFVGEHIIHMIGRKQAEEESRDLVQPEQMSFVGRLVNRLPLWTTNQLFVLDIPCDEPSLNTAPCE